MDRAKIKHLADKAVALRNANGTYMRAAIWQALGNRANKAGAYELVSAVAAELKRRSSAVRHNNRRRSSGFGHAIWTDPDTVLYDMWRAARERGGDPEECN